MKLSHQAIGAIMMALQKDLKADNSLQDIW